MSRSLIVVAALALVLLVGFTLVEARFSDRWTGSNITAEQFAEIFEHVPMSIGSWQGADTDVTEEEQRGSGAVGYVARTYTNSKTGAVVSLWLIVGHSRDICRHTPDVCFPSSGFQKLRKDNLEYSITFDEENGTKADFWTNAFLKEDLTGRQLVRVFWSWYKPNDEGTIAWEAPARQRLHFGNARALYKMYFTSPENNLSETVDRSACVQFAMEFLPELNKAFQQTGLHGEDGDGSRSETADPDELLQPEAP